MEIPSLKLQQFITYDANPNIDVFNEITNKEVNFMVGRESNKRKFGNITDHSNNGQSEDRKNWTVENYRKDAGLLPTSDSSQAHQTEGVLPKNNFTRALDSIKARLYNQGSFETFLIDYTINMFDSLKQYRNNGDTEAFVRTINAMETQRKSNSLIDQGMTRFENPLTQQNSGEATQEEYNQVLNSVISELGNLRVNIRSQMAFTRNMFNQIDTFRRNGNQEGFNRTWEHMESRRQNNKYLDRAMKELETTPEE